MTQKIVISEQLGGFGLSAAALAELGRANHYDLERDDPRLVDVVERLGNDASSRYAKLVVVEIPDGVAWHVAEYDGYEWVAENHRAWNSGGEIKDPS